MDLNVNGVQNVSNVNQIDDVKKTVKQSKVDLSNPVDTVELSSSTKAKKNPSTAKKVGAGIASVLYPGFGQLINGDVKKGLKFFLGQGFVDVAGQIAAMALMSVNPAVGLTVALAAGLTHIGVGIASVVDAVKNAG